MRDESATTAEQFTQLFERARIGDRLAANLVYGMAIPRLRAVAKHLLRRYHLHRTLQPTALIAELFVKIRGFDIRIADREHFFHISARAMHQVLTDRTRAKTARVTQHSTVFDEFFVELRAVTPEFVPLVEDLLSRLARVDQRAARMLRLHYLEGHTWDEVAEHTGVPKWKVREDAEFALQWLRDRYA